tara:strand:- start:356 stop:790 length:435 start_codon:yes stop_codon:yes gene_type:complete
MKVGILNTSKHPNPVYKTEGSAGLDIRANIDKKITLKPIERIAVPTGLHIELPKNTEAQIRPRSGLSLKHGITVLNTPGTIDSDYRGEIKVILINLSDQDFEINDGDRIAQLILNKIAQISWQNIQVLTETNRGGGGFGSTGKK